MLVQLAIFAFLGNIVFENPVLFCLSCLILTSTLSPIINWHTRLNVIAYAFGASLLTIAPIKAVLGDDAILQLIAAPLLLTATIVAPWMIISGKGKTRLITSIVACCLAILPPIGTIASPNPFMTAGYLFPDTGIMGLFLVAGLIIMPAHLPKKIRMIFIVILLATSGLTNFIYKPPTPPENWMAVNTSFQDFYDNPISERNKRVGIIRKEITDQTLDGKEVLITAESVLGINTPGLEPQLNLLSARAKRNNATLLVGVVHKTEGGLENSLLILGQDQGRYDARQPVPLVMWNLWPTTNFKAHWFRAGIREIKGKRAAILICWEEWVPWPLLISSFGNPEIILSASNHGWAGKDSGMWKKQTTSANALARLYGLPMIRAVNISYENGKN